MAEGMAITFTCRDLENISDNPCQPEPKEKSLGPARRHARIFAAGFGNI
jgi:hypothetical protein